MSLIGAAIAGGMAGAGDAATEALHTEQKYVDQSDLQKEYLAAQEQKDLRLAEVNQGYNVTNAATNFGYNTKLNDQTAKSAMDRTQAEQTGQTTRTMATIEGDKAVAGIHETGANSRNEADIAAKWKEATLSNTHYTPQADGTFAVSVPQQDGTLKTTPLTDDKGNLVRGVKNIPENVVKAADGMMAVAKAVLVQDSTNQEAKNQIATAIAMLGVAMPAGPAPSVSEADMTMLFQHGVPSPQDMSDLDEKYHTKGLAASLVAKHMEELGQKGGSEKGSSPKTSGGGGTVDKAPLNADGSVPQAAPGAQAADLPGGMAGADVARYGPQVAALRAREKAAAGAAAKKAQELADARAALAGTQLRNPTRVDANSRFGPNSNVFDQTGTGLIARNMNK